MSTDVIFPILFVPHEIEYRDKSDAMDAREAEGEEGEVQTFFQFDHGARVVGVEGDVCGLGWFDVRYRYSSSGKGNQVRGVGDVATKEKARKGNTLTRT